jgi:hypothetical protein
MIHVTIDSNPGDPEYANQPYWHEVFDTQEEADTWMANVRAHGGAIIEDYEMSDSQCYAHNVNAHCPNGY